MTTNGNKAPQKPKRCQSYYGELPQCEKDYGHRGPCGPKDQLPIDGTFDLIVRVESGEAMGVTGKAVWDALQESGKFQKVSVRRIKPSFGKSVKSS